MYKLISVTIVVAAMLLCSGCSNDWDDISKLRKHNVVMDLELYKSYER